ncbi:hypothetical protein K1W54_42495 [Micromonospora sp. CPCC 205371]|nr:hypothetical protein [Micromonospora sp. CPCC 205371]
MKRLVLVVAAGALALGLAGCGAKPVSLDVEQAALSAIGFEAADPSPSATPSRERPRMRGFLRKNTLHGEIVVDTKDGPKTVVVQRGEVTAIDDDSLTVKSSDGYTIEWAFGDDMRVRERRDTIQPGEVKVGTEVGVAGAKDGDRTVARLVVIPLKR